MASAINKLVSDRSSCREDLHSPVGIVAGNGTLPLALAERARALGLGVTVVAYRGEADPRIEALATSCQWITIGQLGRMRSFLKKSGAREVIFAGGIRRPRLFSGVRLDFAAISLIARLGSVKDDVLLRGVSRELEACGLRVIGADVLLEDIAPEPGLLTSRDFSPEEKKQAAIGWEAARHIGSLDIGQTVVAREGVVVAVEAIDGTDATILRAGTLTLGGSGGVRERAEAGTCRHGRGAVVVKLCKPHQDTRLDLPTIGCDTIEIMARADASALVIEARKTIVLDPAEVVRKANEYGIAIRAAMLLTDII